jgi:predicted porin
MKKSLLALAVLGTMAGAASAQSSVTLFGVVDVNAKYVKNDGFDNRKSLGTDGINSSRLGFRGVEDLGGGLKAGFWLEAGVNPDTGTVNSPQLFNRRSTLSLIGGWGELRLGRDYTPVFWNQTVFDPFGTNGVGSSTNVTHNSAQPTYVRASNSAAYFLPSGLGGLYGWAQIAANEGAAANTGKYAAGRIGYAAGPFDVVAAYGQQYFSPAGGSDGRFKEWNISGSWDFGVAKIMGQFNNEKYTDVAATFVPALEERRYLLGAVVPLGAGELHASWVRNDVRNAGLLGTDSDADQIALGYVYNLSKRTAIYGTGARINNKGSSAFSVSGGTSSPGGPNPGGDSTGFELGIRHFF